jgi:hypothetical protein
LVLEEWEQIELKAPMAVIANLVH